MYIEIEGIDGAGKSTQAELLKIHFNSLGMNSIVIKELDSTEFSKQVKKILSADIANNARAEMFLFLSCKCQVYSQLIKPSLDSGKIVIGDRGAGSFISYNSSVLAMKRDALNDLLNICSFGNKPDLTILLDIPVEVARDRIAKKIEQSRFDLVDSDILHMHRNKFLEIADTSSNWVIIDGTEPIKHIHDLIIQNAMSLAGNF